MKEAAWGSSRPLSRSYLTYWVRGGTAKRWLSQGRPEQFEELQKEALPPRSNPGTLLEPWPESEDKENNVGHDRNLIIHYSGYSQRVSQKVTFLLKMLIIILKSYIIIK